MGRAALDLAIGVLLFTPWVGGSTDVRQTGVGLGCCELQLSNRATRKCQSDAGTSSYVGAPLARLTSSLSGEVHAVAMNGETVEREDLKA